MTDSAIPVNDEVGAQLLQTYENLINGELVHAEAVVQVDINGNPISSSNRFPVDAGLSRDAFTRLKVSFDANQTEVPYDDANWATFVDQTSSGGAPAAAQANGQVTISSGTGANGKRIVLSKDATKYRLGHEVGWGGTFRFDAVGIANADVWWGASDDVNLTNAVIFGWFSGTWGVRYRRGGATVWTKTVSEWISGWETAYGQTFDKTRNQIARIRAGLFGHRGFAIELASPIPNADGSVNWIKIIDQTAVNAETVAIFTNNDLKLGMGVVKTGADATDVSVTSACQAGWAASDKARISDTLSDRTLASRVVAALVGRTNSGSWVGVNVNNQGRLFVTNDSVGATGAAVPTSAALVAGSDDGGILRAARVDSDGTQIVRELTRSRGNPLTEPFTITSSGSPHVLSPSVPTNAIRVFWVSASTQPGGLSYPLITVTLPTVADPAREIYRQYSISHAEMFEGAAGADLTVATGGVGTVSGMIHYEEFTP